MKRKNHQSHAALCWTTSLILSLASLAAHAEFCGTDNFSSGSANWDAVVNDRNASLTVTNSRYEYTATGAGTERDEVFYRWNVNQGSYTNDWAVQVDVHLSAFPGLTSDQSVNMDMVIQEGTNINHLYDVAIDRSNNGAPVMDFYTGLYTDSGATYSAGISNPATNASLRISFDSVAQTLTAWYATDGAANGPTWIPIETIDIPSDWGMTAASQFNVGLAVGSGANGSSSGSASDIAVTSGQAYFENFVATSSACPTSAMPTVTVTVLANPSNGGTVSGGGTYPVGTNVQISASANSGWTFAGWSDGGAQTHNITVPSGGATYTASFSPQSQPTVATPMIAPDGGDFADSVRVTLTCATPKAVIYYTTDGSEPTSDSPKYKRAITLTNSVTINAVAFAGTNGPSDTATASFTINRPSITTASELPSGSVSNAYTVAFQATGGTAPYKWSLAKGSKLPASLKLNATTGVLAGKPTKSGTFNFTVKVTDAKKQPDTQSLTLIIGN